MKQVLTLSMTLLVLVFFTGCSSTKITKSWADPSVTNGSFKGFSKALVIATLKDQTNQRTAEDHIVAALKAGVGVPSYKYLTDADTSEAAVRARLKQDGFDGLISMKLTNVSQSLTAQTHGYTYGYYGIRFGYGWGYGPVYGSAATTVSVDETYFVETTIYSLPDYKLIWSGTTSTLNPGKLDKSIDEVIEAVKGDLVAKGIVKQP